MWHTELYYVMHYQMVRIIVMLWFCTFVCYSHIDLNMLCRSVTVMPRFVSRPLVNI